MAALAGKRIAIIVHDNFEQAELAEPKAALEAAGAETVVISSQEGPLHGLNHLEPADEIGRDLALEDADFDTFDALLLPGGVYNADKLRMDEDVREVVSDFMENGRPVAAICHAPWVLVSAGLVKGRKLTSYYTLQDDVRNAGGDWTDQEVVIDDNLVTSRTPDDIPAFNRALIGLLTTDAD